MFKSSQAMEQIDVEMDHEGPKSPLEGKEAYFDGSHLWCISYKTPVLLVYHPVMQCILKILTMAGKLNLLGELASFDNC